MTHVLCFMRRALCPLLTIALLVPLTSHAQSDRLPVIASYVEATRWSDPLEALGTLRADESVTISSTVTEIVAELNFSDGEAVEAGQLLIRLQDAEEQAQLRAAQAQADERRNAVERSSQLQQRNLGSRADVEDSRAQLRRVEAEVEALEARIASHRIRAPFDGIVGLRDISTGTLVTPGMDLLTLDKLDVVKLDFSVPEVNLASLRPGLTLTARTPAYPDDTFEGEIATVGTRVDPVTRSVSVRAVLPNAERRLRPGMLMEVILQRQPRDALVVPEASLVPSGERHSVFLINEQDDHQLERREVKVGERRSGEAEILEGLEGGELLVRHGLQRARDGSPVDVLGIAGDESEISDILQRHRGLQDADGAEGES
ncbi:efflux RND transporter periplasmic adaptor subunit [Litchfieldella xinjiangensis]|uniref:efflux RND transporter periplasmic adaptor subunit n=1 Tax=Litchfieldella xinjiangensis TaxID=1166948 RepID=UPI000693C10F|nr:efflux RND transporter periplasmic adaptor subunit [Halomonas xinjiangensis]